MNCKSKIWAAIPPFKDLLILPYDERKVPLSNSITTKIFTWKSPPLIYQAVCVELAEEEEEEEE